MIIITKNEAFKMREIGFGELVNHKKGYSRYYMVEEPKGLRALEKYRSDCVVKR